MDKKFIGLNAGIIWRIISDQQKWKYSELKQKSGLEDTFYLQFNMYI